MPTTDPTAVRASIRGRLVGLGLVALAELLAESPVDHDGLTEFTDEDVLRLEIAMDHALPVRVRDRIDDGEHVRQ